MKTVTYHSVNAKPDEAWLAYIELPNGQQWLVRCSAATELEAIEKATSLWEAERAKAVALEPHRTSDAPSSTVKPSGKGHWFTGLKWVLNRSTGHKARVRPDEVAGYLANGYIQAGPRST